MKKISNELLYRYSFLSAVQSNPAGNRAIFLRQVANREANRYDAYLYLYEAGNIVKLSSCGKVKEACWLDDRRVLFVSGRDSLGAGQAENAKGFGKDRERVAPPTSGKEDTKQKTEDCVKLFIKDVCSPSEAELFAELPGEAFCIRALDDKTLIYLKEREIQERDEAYFWGQQDEEGFMRIRRIPFYADGGSFGFRKKTSCYLYRLSGEEAAGGEEKELNAGAYSYESYEVSACKQKIILIASRIQSRASSYNALFEYDIAGDRLRKILDDAKADGTEPYQIYLASYLDNKPFFLGTMMKKHGVNENAIACALSEGRVEVLNDEDIEYLNASVQDMELAAGRQLHTSQDYIDLIRTRGTYNTIIRLGKDGTQREHFSFEGGISCFDYVDGKLIFIGLDTEGGQELFLENEKVSNFHDFLQDYSIAEPMPFCVDSGGTCIEGFVLLPQDYEEKDSHPAVLEIHGGPKAAYQRTYFHEMQMLASEGYVVMYCNPRGSAGRGNEFADIFSSYGEVDYQNIMDFTEAVLQAHPKIDRDRLFVTGGSYGGYMTNHIVTQTDRFRAAVTQRSISNWISMYGTSDIGYYFSPDQHRISKEDPDFWLKLWEVSPLRNVDRVKTPTLVIHSEHDFRCPLEQGYQFFTALLDRGVESELLVFKGESHGLSRTGRPKNRFERLEAIKNWFAKHDK